MGLMSRSTGRIWIRLYLFISVHSSFVSPLLIAASLSLLSSPAYSQSSPVMDSCGGAPGDPPYWLFEQGSAMPHINGPPERLRIWRERLRPDIKLVLLTGTADPAEHGYKRDLSLRRAQAVQAVMIGLGIDADAIWIRGQTKSASELAKVNLPATMSRRVDIGDPMRSFDCEHHAYQEQVSWFVAHCTASNIDAETKQACDTLGNDMKADEADRGK